MSPPKITKKPHAEAYIEEGAIEIRVPIAVLAAAVKHGPLGSVAHVTDEAKFAKELVLALNNEDEVGTTPIHRLFDEATQVVFDDGGEGIDAVASDK